MSSYIITTMRWFDICQYIEPNSSSLAPLLVAPVLFRCYLFSSLLVLCIFTIFAMQGDLFIVRGIIWSNLLTICSECLSLFVFTDPTGLWQYCEKSRWLLHQTLDCKACCEYSKWHNWDFFSTTINFQFERHTQSEPPLYCIVKNVIILSLFHYNPDKFSQTHLKLNPFEPTICLNKGNLSYLNIAE